MPSMAKALNPFTLPVFFFAGTILAGTVVLRHPMSLTGEPLRWIDALFTATSATCVTGLIVVDTGKFFSPLGHAVILLLIQLGGLGIMTYTTLVFYLWRRKVTLTDRLAVGQSLLYDPTFNLGRFLVRMVLLVLGIETAGALALWLLDPSSFHPFSAVFHAVSAFCNAGFDLFSTSLTGFGSNLAINAVFMILIVLGGLGFSVLVETAPKLRCLVLGRGLADGGKLSWHTRTVLVTTVFLIFTGWAWIFLSEFLVPEEGESTGTIALASLFQSVTTRTAGFNTIDLTTLAMPSLVLMMLFMLIGGSPGSCAGGIKTTTFRTLLSFAISQIRGREQSVVGRFAVDSTTLNRALTLGIFASVIITAATLVLTVTEGGLVARETARGLFMDILFEVVSAFGTVGLSLGLTTTLSDTGKVVIVMLMFVGRLGPILFLSILQSLRKVERYSWPEESMLIG
jgi:trk system potassium uptake protein